MDKLLDQLGSLIEAPTPRRIITLISVLCVVFLTVFGYEIYTDNLRLDRLQKATNLLQQLQGLGGESSIPEKLRDVHEGILSELETITSHSTEAQQMHDSRGPSIGWILRFMTGGLIWFGVAVCFIYVGLRKDREGWLGFIVFFGTGAALGLFNALIPMYGNWWTHLLVFPLAITSAMLLVLQSVYVFMESKQKSIEVKIKNNLKQIVSSAQQYMLEHNKSVATVQDAKDYLSALTSISGETYDKLVVSSEGGYLNVTTRDGRTVSIAY